MTDFRPPPGAERALRHALIVLSLARLLHAILVDPDPTTIGEAVARLAVALLRRSEKGRAPARRRPTDAV